MFFEKAKRLGAKRLICSEKDIVKLDERILNSLPIAYLEIDFEMSQGLDEWEAQIQKIKNICG